MFESFFLICIHKKKTWNLVFNWSKVSSASIKSIIIFILWIPIKVIQNKHIMQNIDAKQSKNFITIEPVIHYSKRSFLWFFFQGLILYWMFDFFLRNNAFFEEYEKSHLRKVLDFFLSLPLFWTQFIRIALKCWMA
jgi:hypothetical protein